MYLHILLVEIYFGKSSSIVVKFIKWDVHCSVNVSDYIRLTSIYVK